MLEPMHRASSMICWGRLGRGIKEICPASSCSGALKPAKSKRESCWVSWSLGGVIRVWMKYSFLSMSCAVHAATSSHEKTDSLVRERYAPSHIRSPSDWGL